MSLSLGTVSLRPPVKELALHVLQKADTQSVLCALVFFIVFIILAYLTNPTETSFRAYLTEQSFRQHLSRLDDNTDVTTEPASNAPPADACPSFHFANRASVSLRTPKHVFHSFGIFTIAAVAPLTKSESAARSTDRDGSAVSDSWFIGAFGKWWRGGAMDDWYHDVIARSKEEEGWSSGILGFKPTDKHNDYDGLPFATKSVPVSRGSPPKLRNRDKSSRRPGLLPVRSTTPPPLPKSASLPLHSTLRTLPGTSSHLAPQANAPAQPTLHPNNTTATEPPVHLTSPVPTRSPSTLFEQSPAIAEVLRQISATKLSVSELHTQLSDAQASAEHTHAQLATDVDACRERKRAEDSARAELKTKTKSLEDAKRTAEGAKRDAEKRLRAAQNAQDDANNRKEHLDQEIVALQQRAVEDQAAVVVRREEFEKDELEISKALEDKKSEIKAAEDIVAALNLRARELEEHISAEREKLKTAKEQAELKKQDRSFFPLHTGVNPPNPHVPAKWAPISFAADPDFRVRDAPDLTASRPTLSLGAVHHFNDTKDATTQLHNGLSLRSKGYSIFNDDLAALRLSTSNFSPFDDSDNDTPIQPNYTHLAASGLISPTSSALIPSALAHSLDRFDSSDNLSRSFQSESDAVIDREWRGPVHAAPGHSRQLPMLQLPEDSSNSGVVSHSSASPTSLTESHDFDFDFDGMPAYENRDRRHRATTDDVTLEHQVQPGLYRTNSDPTSHPYTRNDSATQLAESMSLNFVKDPEVVAEKSMFGNASRRWFSNKEKTPKKGLNPDAKVFNFSRKSLSTRTATATPASTVSYDALNPNGLVIAPSGPTTSSFLHAFAPSPAEREALQRALGGSTNASLERLPSLSDVSSIPSSPQPQPHTHLALPEHHTRGVGMMSKGLPNWLQSLPLMRKPAFSPWDEDDQTAASEKRNIQPGTLS